SYGTARTGAYGAGTRRTYGALGEETNMAARLMGAAVPGTVYASAAFVRLAQEEYEFATLPPVKVKGHTDPVVVFELIGRKGTPTSVTRSTAGGPRLIGRQEELEAILSAFGDAAAGRGGVVQLTAEAGIGKSHLIAAALAELDPKRAEVVSGASQSFERTMPYRLWRG